MEGDEDEAPVIGQTGSGVKAGGETRQGRGGDKEECDGLVIEVDEKAAVWASQRRRETECGSCEYLLLKVKSNQINWKHC